MNLSKHEITQTMAALASQLEEFGRSDNDRKIIAAAIEENDWFSEQSIRRAVEAVREEMLDAQKLAAWLDGYPLPVAEAKTVGLITAGNIPLVGFFDLLCVAVSGHKCLFKPSSKDAVLMNHMVEMMCRLQPDFAIGRLADDSAIDALIATGSDNTNRYFRQLYPTARRLLRHSRHSVGVVSHSTSDRALEGMMDDIYSYCSLGCRNLSLIFVPDDFDMDRLLAIKAALPQQTNRNFADSYRQERAVAIIAGEEFIDAGDSLWLWADSFPAKVSRIHFARYAHIDRVKEWIDLNRDAIQCTAGDQPFCDTPFGHCQQPSLSDWPDGVDVLDFLSSL